MALEYYSFEKVLKELQMDEDELKRLVSEGQIRAFRDEDKMKFRADDIDGLKKGRQTEPTIILPPSEDDDRGSDDIMLVDDDTDETLLDLEDLGGDDIGESDETSIPSLDMDDDEDSSADTLTEELVFDDDLGLEDGAETDEIATQETFIDEDEEVGMTTEPLDLDEEEEEEKPKTVIATRRAAATARAPRGSGRVSGPMPEEEDEISPLMVGLAIVAALILLFIGLLFMDVAREKHTGFSGNVAAMVQKNFSKDGEPVWFTKEKKGKAEEDDTAGLEEDEEEEEEEPEEEE
ncbi:MAG: hypothetical protein ACYTHN_21985 [Planctomycetota bacterium]